MRTLIVLAALLLATQAQASNLFWEHAAFGNRVIAHYGGLSRSSRSYTVNYRANWKQQSARRSAYNRARRAHLYK